jgi:septal ring factor EnvC (AmiA/AmiB activator)
MLVYAETAQAINDKQYRYMSAEYDENYHDKTSGEEVGAVLLGAALVNQPANPHVAPLVLADDINPERTDDDMSELEGLKQQLKETQAQVDALQSATADKTRDVETLTARIAELEAENKTLKSERKAAEKSRNEAEVKAFCDKWTGKGIPPAALEKVKPLLLSEQSRVIRLSENASDDVPSLKFFDELFEGMPKVAMTQVSSTEKPGVELSDVERAIAHGKAIA